MQSIRYDAAIICSDDDKKTATRIEDWSKSQGFRTVLLDSTSYHLDPEPFRFEMTMRVLDNSRNVIVLLSQNTHYSEWIKRVIELAINGKYKVIPCFIGSSSAPLGYYFRDLPKQLVEIQPLDLRSKPEAPNKIDLDKLRIIFSNPQIRNERMVELGTTIPGWATTLHALKALMKALRFAVFIALLVILIVVLYPALLSLIETTKHNISYLFDSFSSMFSETYTAGLVLAGLVLCGLGAVMWSTRHLLELIAAWRILENIHSSAGKKIDS